MKDKIENAIRISSMAIIMTTIIITCIFALHKRDKYEEAYNEGVSLLKQGNYDEAIEYFSEIPDYIEYKDTSDLLEVYDVDTVCPYCGHVLK